MKKHYRWVIIGGIIIFVLPLIGIPYAWKMVIQFVVGLGLILLGLIEKSMFVYSESDEPAFEESRGPVMNEAQESMFETNGEKEINQ